MQFSTLFAAASVLAGFVSAAPVSNFVKFTIESENKDLDGKGLYSRHEGAAINYVFLADQAQTLNLNTTSGAIYLSAGNSDGQSFPQFLSVLENGFPGLQVSASGAPVTTWTFENGYLKGNGSDAFFIAKDTKDPYNYSKDNYQIGLFPNIGSSVSAATAGYSNVNPVKVKVAQSATA